MKLAASLFAFAFTFTSLSPTSFAAHPLGEDLSLGWRLIKNSLDTESEEEKFLAEITITNQSAVPLGSEGWRLYFCSLRKFTPSLPADEVRMTHINGDLFRLEPTSKFLHLGPGESRAFSIRGVGSLTKECEFPTGHYFVFYDSQGNEKSVSATIEAKIALFESLEQTTRNPNDLVPVPTAASRYEENLQLSKLPVDQVDLVLPTPRKLT